VFSNIYTFPSIYRGGICGSVKYSIGCSFLKISQGPFPEAMLVGKHGCDYLKIMDAPQGHLGMTNCECILFNVFPPIPSMYFHGRKLIAEPDKPEQFQKIFSET